MMMNLLNKHTMLVGSVALAAILIVSAQSANAQGVSSQPNRGGNFEPNRVVMQNHGQSPKSIAPHHTAGPNFVQPMKQNNLPLQHFGHQNSVPKKAEPHKVAQLPAPIRPTPTPFLASAHCNHQPTRQVIVIGQQPKKPSLLEKIVSVFW